MQPPHLLDSRVREFHIQHIVYREALEDYRKDLVSDLEGRLVRDAWRAGFYFDRRPVVTEIDYQHPFDPPISKPSLHLEIHLQAVGLALPEAD